MICLAIKMGASQQTLRDGTFFEHLNQIYWDLSRGCLDKPENFQ